MTVRTRHAARLAAAAVAVTAAAALPPPSAEAETLRYAFQGDVGSLDSWNALFNVVHTRDPETGAGTFNLGGYSNERIDELTAKILTETDLAKRGAMIREAWQVLHDDVGYIPLHQQALAWGARENVDLVQRADNQFLWRYITVN